MFHTLFDYQDQNVANNKQIPKTKSKGFINKSSKNKSLSNYFTKTCNKIKHGLKRNYTNKNLLKINNDNISNYNQYIKNIIQ